MDRSCGAGQPAGSGFPRMTPLRERAGAGRPVDSTVPAWDPRLSIALFRPVLEHYEPLFQPTVVLGTLPESSGEAGGHVSKATVYNTLNLFVAQGLAREIHADPKHCVYDSTMEPHHHFQNLDTGEMIDIRPEDLEFARMPELPPDTEVESVDVVIRVRRKV